MKILKKEQIVQRILELHDINELNMSLSEIFLNIVGRYDDKIINIVENSSNQKDAFLKEILDILEIDLNNEEDIAIWNSRIAPNIIELSPTKYINNPYNKINIDNIVTNKYELIKDHYDKFEIFSLCDIQVDEQYNETTKLAYFNKQYDFIALNENRTTWMSITPNEIETMEKSIDNAHGNVVIYGLGLGYFPYMISNKANVSNITIVENNKNIIDLFNKFLLPQFPNKNKIEIVFSDAFQYKIEDNTDYVFVDLWHNAEDGISTFLKFKKNETKNIVYSYWLEDSFYALLRRAFLTLLYEQLIGESEDSYKLNKTVFDSLVNKYFYATKNVTISSVDDINNLVTNEALLKLIIA